MFVLFYEYIFICCIIMLLKNILRTICEQSQNFLCEDPDTVFKTDEDGNEIEIGLNDSKSYTFIVGKKFALVSASSENYHSGILWVANKAASIIDNDKNAMNAEELAAYMNKSSVVVTNPEEFYNEMTSKTGAFYKEVNQKAFRDNSRKIKGFVAGRYWIHKKIISFWNPQEEVLNVWDGIEDMMHKMHITDFDEYEIDWVERDDEHFKSLGKASKVKSKSVEKVAPLDKEKYLALLKKVHVATPEEKKKIMSQLGADVPSKAAQIADKLGMTAAQFNALMNVNEVIKEDPDQVLFPDETGDRDYHKEVYYSDGDSYTFICGKNYAFVSKTNKNTHCEMLDTVFDCIKHIIDGNFDELEIEQVFIDEDIHVTDLEAFYDEIINYGGGKQSNLADFYYDNRDDIPDEVARNVPGFLSGRYWKDDKIISFWNKRGEVIKNWSAVEKMMDYMNINDFSSYFVDWIERTIEYNKNNTLSPLTPVKSVKTDKPAAKIKDAEYKELLKKLHAASPEEKKRMFKKLGADVPSKASRIADKLGMTVAQFNHLTKVNENN